MKTIKYFSFAILLSLAWVACKNSGSTTTTETESGMVSDSLAAVIVKQKEEINKWVAILTDKVNETEAAISAEVDEAQKTLLQGQLDNFKKTREDAIALAEKVGNATAENWAEVSDEINFVHYDLKTALSGLKLDSPTTIRGTSSENQ